MVEMIFKMNVSAARTISGGRERGGLKSAVAMGT